MKDLILLDKLYKKVFQVFLLRKVSSKYYDVKIWSQWKNQALEFVTWGSWAFEIEILVLFDRAADATSRASSPSVELIRDPHQICFSIEKSRNFFQPVLFYRYTTDYELCNI